MSTIIIVIVLALIVVGMILLVVAGVRRARSQEVDPLEARLAELSQRGEPVSLEEIELSQPFVDRVILPMIRRLGEISSRFTPQHVLEQTRKKLEMAGNPGNMDASTFIVLHFVSAAIFGGLLLIISLSSKTFTFSTRLLLVLLFSVLGYFFPELYLRSRIERRQRSIRKAMPDALDLLTICVEAGLGFDAAMSKVSEKWTNDLALAFARVIREIQLGKLRRDALRDMADRLGIPEMTSFVAAVVQSEMLGVSLAKVLRVQADQMRIRRRQRAEEEAHKAPIKMILPLGLFVFPSLMIVLLTPAALKLVGSLGALR
ncbi:MAG: type II secretion system F family protein [Anaerolineales bacterium]|nr:type II secretion system F family protein [Anaerolineales bacterium]MDW8226661.1 type II secretion system F family protein [Anaerolineales bacterium]